jgi:hypothetical protein
MSTWSDLIREAREDNEPRSWCGGCALWRLAFEGAEAPRPDGAVVRDGLRIGAVEHPDAMPPDNPELLDEVAVSALERVEGLRPDEPVVEDVIGAGAVGLSVGAFERAEVRWPAQAIRDGPRAGTFEDPEPVPPHGPAARDAHRVRREASSTAPDVRTVHVPTAPLGGASSSDATDLGSTR